MALHFKFRSAVEYDSINIDGHFMSVASLKEKIIEQKNLGKGTEFDLLITNAQTGEEYTDDAYLVPKNTSVIIKRVPASRAKLVLRGDDLSRSQATKHMGSDAPHAALAPTPLPDVGMDTMDDFGVDLYAIPEPLPTRIDSDENIRISAMVNKTASDWQRQTQEAFSGGRGFGRLSYGRGLARGRGYGRALPPQGYVCHRCGQPGHFIQHCPTNGDPAYDIRRVKLPVGIPKTRLKADQEGSYILPDGSAAVMQPDESVFAKEADALLSIRPTLAEPPEELRCPLCQAIFKDAVMIPCCHYSFCDKCIRQELISKAKCPQCSSTKFKNDDLLPNIALRQAIDCFLESQVPAESADEGTKLQQAAPDVGSSPQMKAPSTTVPRLQIELRKPSTSSASVPPPAENLVKVLSPTIVEEHASNSADGPTDNIPTAEKEGGPEETGECLVDVNIQTDPKDGEIPALPPAKEIEDLTVVQPVVIKDIPDLTKEGGKHPVNEDVGGSVSKLLEPPSSKGTEAIGVESEIGKGKKKKKRARLIMGDGTFDHMGSGKMKRVQGDRFCFVCGSPEHLARDCMDNPEVAHPPHPSMFGPGVPGGLPPYGPEIFWHGPPIPQHGRPFAVGFVEGMYSHGPGPGPMSFDVPMMPRVPYNVAPYMPPMFHGGPIHPGYMGGGMHPTGIAPVERPLSREEFMDLQERERRRRLLHDRLQGNWSPERAHLREGNILPQTPDSEKMRYEHLDRRGGFEEHHSLARKRELDGDSVRNYSDENDFYKSKIGRFERKHVSLVDNNSYRRPISVSDDDVVSFDDLKTRRVQLDKRQRDGKTVSISIKRETRHYRDDHLERVSSGPEDDVVQPSYSSRRHEKRLKDSELHSSRHSRHSHTKRSDDAKNVHTGGSGGDGCSNRHRSKKEASENTRHDIEYSEDKVSVRASKHSRGDSRSQELDGRYCVHGLSSYDYEQEDEVRESEKPKRRKHGSHSKSKGEVEIGGNVSADESKRKRRKHRKHREDGGHDKNKDSKNRIDVPDNTSKHGTQNDGVDRENSLLDNIEDTRWQLDSGMDEVKASFENWSKHKHPRSHNVKLKQV